MTPQKKHKMKLAKTTDAEIQNKRGRMRLGREQRSPFWDLHIGVPRRNARRPMVAVSLLPIGPSSREPKLPPPEGRVLSFPHGHLPLPLAAGLPLPFPWPDFHPSLFTEYSPLCTAPFSPFGWCPPPPPHPSVSQRPQSGGGGANPSHRRPGCTGG